MAGRPFQAALRCRDGSRSRHRILTSGAGEPDPRRAVVASRHRGSARRWGSALPRPGPRPPVAVEVTRYDAIGHGYARVRREDPRIAARIHAALSGCRSIVNVGAGTGSYEPEDREVVAVEPSAVMVRQRGPGAAPALRGCATALPFPDGAFDGSLAILTLHHWPDLERGLDELRRVARKRTVLLTFDTGVGGFWLTDYFPEILAIDAASMPSIERLRGYLGEVEVLGLPVPHDCEDGFLGAYWRRPEAYLEPGVRNGISVFSRLARLESGLESLRSDLASGAWHRRYGQVMEKEELDLGYRLIVVQADAEGHAGDPRQANGAW